MKKSLIILVLMLFSFAINLNATTGGKNNILSYSIIGKEINKVTVNMPARITILKGDHSSVRVVGKSITEKQIKCVVSKGNLVVMMNPRYLYLLNELDYVLHIFVITPSNSVEISTRNKTTLGIKKTKNGYHNKK